MQSNLWLEFFPLFQSATFFKYGWQWILLHSGINETFFCWADGGGGGGEGVNIHLIQQGRGLEGPGSPLIFWSNWGPKGGKSFLETDPPYLKVWSRHCSVVW